MKTEGEGIGKRGKGGASNGKLVDGWGSSVAKSDAGIPCQHPPSLFLGPILHNLPAAQSNKLALRYVWDWN